jgi:hypothetical protein
MGALARIANPLKMIRARSKKGSSAALSEQRIGGGAVRGNLAVMRLDPRNLGFEQRDPFIQLGLRIGAEILAREATRRVSAGPGAIWFFHCVAASGPSSLLSIGDAVIRDIKLVNVRVLGADG